MDEFQIRLGGSTLVSTGFAAVLGKEGRVYRCWCEQTDFIFVPPAFLSVQVFML